MHGGITIIYAEGFLSAYYASYLYPSRRVSVAGFSGAVNGFSTAMMPQVLEPRIAVTTDQVLRGETDYNHLKGIAMALVFSKLGGLLTQVLFVQWRF